MNDTTVRSEAHSTFVIERTYPTSVDAVWHALSDNHARDQWFGGGASFDTEQNTHDFRVGGHAVNEGQWHGGPRSKFLSTYTDIVDRQRMVFTYDMWIDGEHLSTSLTTIAIEPDGEATRLTYTEQGVFLDGLDAETSREEGTRGILDQLGEYLSSTA